MTQSNDVWNMFQQSGAILRNDHFVYAKGEHGSEYVNKDAVFRYPRTLSLLCRHIAQAFADDDIEVVIGPVVGGALVAQWTAYHLAELYDRDVVAIYADKGEKSDQGAETYVLKRGYDLETHNKRVLVAEDIVNSGSSARKVVDLVRSYGGHVIGVAALCNRGGVTLRDLNVPRGFWLTEVSMAKYAPESCPLCKSNVPINTSVGKGAAFLARRR